jgi:hypothetical protein
VISEDSERDVQRQSLQRVAEEVDDRDWRARAPAAEDDAAGAGWARAPAQSGGGERAERAERAPQQQQQQGGERAPRAERAPQQQQQGGPPQGGQQQWQGKELPKIQKAEDLGRQKYVVGAAVEGTERVRAGCEGADGRGTGG